MKRTLVIIFFVLIAFAIVILAADEEHKRPHRHHNHKHHDKHHKHHDKHHKHHHEKSTVTLAKPTVVIRSKPPFIPTGQPTVVIPTPVIPSRPPFIPTGQPTVVIPSTTTSSAATPTSTGQGQADNNICKTSKKAPGHGAQDPNGQCSNTVQGEIPNVNHMVSTLIISPDFGSVQKANQAFNVTIAITGLHTGFFSDPKSQYYVFPQKLDENGLIFGHYHITVQKLDSVVKPPNPVNHAFFKGLEDPANDKNQLSVEVDGLEAGLYRICTIGGSESHQPFLMPVAQRGSQDDCIRITVK